MIPEEKVLNEIKEYTLKLFAKISELKVTEQERQTFEEEKAIFQKRLNDYKLHKAALLEREKRLDA